MLQISVHTYAMASNYSFSGYWLLYLTLALPFHYCWPALELTGGDPVPSDKSNIQSNNSDSNIINSNNTEKDASALMTQVKSLNTFANHIDNEKSSTIESPSLDAIENNEDFKPSIRLADREDNLIPIMPIHSSQFNALPLSKTVSPVLVQYQPQTVYQNGVRYLHLVPTKPLMIPFSSFINAQTIPSQFSNHPPQLLLAPNNARVGNFPLPAAPINTMSAPYKLPSAPAMLRSSLLFNHALGNIGSSSSLENRLPNSFPSATLITISSAPSEIPSNGYHLQSVPNHYTYRSSRDLKEHFSAPIFSLNLNEYLPEASKSLPIRVKGRP